MRFTAKIEDGKVKWHDERGLKRYLSKLEGEVYVDIKPSNRRNTAQNNYYWIMLKQFGHYVGYYSEEMHDVCKRRFKIKSTKELNVDEFSEYLDRIYQWAAELKYDIQDPCKPLRIKIK